MAFSFNAWFKKRHSASGVLWSIGQWQREGLVGVLGGSEDISTLAPYQEAWRALLSKPLLQPCGV